MRPLHPDELVSVSLPMNFGRQDTLEFHVVTVIDSVVALDPRLRGDTRLLPDLVRNCYLAVGNGHGLMALKGHLYQRSPGDWRFKISDQHAQLEIEGGRMRICAPIALSPEHADAADTPLEATTVNVGTDGTLVDGEADLAPGQRVSLSLSLPGQDEPIEAIAQLLSRRGSLLNFGYEAMETADRNRLASFIIQDQRAALRRRRSWSRREIQGLDDDLGL